MQNPSPVAPPKVDERDRASLKRYLLSFEWPYRDPVNAEHLVDGGLPLWQQILEFVPNPPARGRALEIGSPPFHISLLLEKFRNYELVPTAFTADGSREFTMELESKTFAETRTYRCECFDAERERFPYDDNSFDLVIWSEVIEHLTLNPVHTLGEIHRVLKPGGCVVISTPNATRADSVYNFITGTNIYDPYHLGAVFEGSRHSREYTFAELTHLVKGCGYAVDQAEDIDIYPPVGRLRKTTRLLLNHGVSRLTHGHYRFHLFVRARKTNTPFRHFYPDYLFDQGHLAFHTQPTESRVDMGRNDTLHIWAGWSALRQAPTGENVRRCGDVGDMFLLLGRPAKTLRAGLANGSGELQAWHQDPAGSIKLGEVRFEAGPELVEVTVPITGPHDPSRPVHVRLDTPGGVDLAWAELS